MSGKPTGPEIPGLVFGGRIVRGEAPEVDTSILVIENAEGVRRVEVKFHRRADGVEVGIGLDPSEADAMGRALRAAAKVAGFEVPN